MVVCHIRARGPCQGCPHQRVTSVLTATVFLCCRPGTAILKRFRLIFGCFAIRPRESLQLTRLEAQLGLHANSALVTWASCASWGVGEESGGSGEWQPSTDPFLECFPGLWSWAEPAPAHRCFLKEIKGGSCWESLVGLEKR